MDIEGSVYATAELLSLRYPMSTSPTANSPCSSGSLLLSSPWPISPSPPSSSSLSSSPPTFHESTILSLSSCSSSSSSSSPPAATSPELGLPATAPTAVIFTTTSAAVSSCAPTLTLGDPVSSSPSHAALDGAHAPGKSIFCVHEQDRGDLIHFSTSNGQLNHVNGNGSGNGSRSGNAATNLSHVIQPDNRDKGFQSHLELNNISTSANNTDGNLFPTLILTSAGSASSSGDMIPMRLYASLTSVPPTTSSTSIINANSTSSMLTINDDENANLPSGTCILMTPQHHHDDDLHQLVSSSNHHHQHGLLHDDENNNHGGTTFTLGDFTTLNQSTNDTNNSTNIISGQQSSLGTTMLSMDDCFNGSKDHHHMTLNKLASSVEDFSTSHHGKLKDILMNGNSHHTLLHNPNGSSSENYILRDLEATYSNSGGTSTSNVNSSSINGTGQGHHQQQEHTFVIPKEEDDLEELKLHSSEQSSFNDAINSIYNSSHHHHHSNPFCTTDSNGDLIMVTADAHDLDNVYSSGVISSVGTIPPPISISTSSSTWTSTTHNGGGLSRTLPTISIIDEALILKDETLGTIDEDDLLEAKEELDDDEDGIQDGSGAKGELKCKFCGFVCCSKSSLGIHERRHTGERPFACKYCGRLFNSAQCCKHHERLHTGDKPFQCSYCGKKYAVSTRLKRHERVHTREEPYKCTECNKTFRWFDAFRDHRNTHTGVPLYLCSVCGKTFTSYLKFYYHERGHLMKKERDRDRLAKQKQSMPGAGVKVPKPIPSATIDIIKSLQQNSSACIISNIALCSSSVVTQVQNGNKKNGGKGQRKASSKAKKNTACF